jgi:arabinofuranosyltransferase
VANILRRDVRRLTEGDDRPLILSTGPYTNGDLRVMPLSPAVPDVSAFSYSNMGIAERVTWLETTVVDVNGLASPLAGHLEVPEERSRPGHEKWLPAAWVIAEYADPAAIETMVDTPDATRAQALAARRALGCGPVKELLESVDEPMSVRRFWANLTGSVARTALRVPADPFEAERRYCGG